MILKISWLKFPNENQTEQISKDELISYQQFPQEIKQAFTIKKDL